MISIYVDFQNSDSEGRARLNTVGSIEDLNRQGVVLKDGLVVRLYGDEFELQGIVEFSGSEHMWVAKYKWEDRKPLGPDE